MGWEVGVGGGGGKGSEGQGGQLRAAEKDCQHEAIIQLSVSSIKTKLGYWTRFCAAGRTSEEKRE
jgi:hypothetical protein